VRMNDAVATLIGAVIGFGGAVVALFGQRYLQTRGKIILRTSRWKLTHAEDDSATYSLSITAFNEMDVSTGARDVRVVFDKPGILENVASTPKDAEDDHRIDALDLPSHKWITKDLRGTIGADLRTRLGDSYNVKVKGILPRGVEIEHDVCLEGEENVDDSYHEHWHGPWHRRAFR
jgi:hypothetical protein